VKTVFLEIPKQKTNKKRYRNKLFDADASEEIFIKTRTKLIELS
jgi:hypothetical protein